MPASISGQLIDLRPLTQVALGAPDDYLRGLGLDAIALLDTGANVSGMSLEMADRLGLPDAGTVDRHAGGHYGQRPARWGEVSFLALNAVGSLVKYTARRTKFIIDKMTDPHYEVVIGMDVLSNMDFHLQRGGHWTLALPIDDQAASSGSVTADSASSQSTRAFSLARVNGTFAIVCSK